MPGIQNIFVLIKQVPDQSAKAGINPDGTIDRAKAKRMLNPFDRYALQAALHTKKNYGGKVTAISMGPPAAVEVLLEALEHGVDKCYLLSDKRLAASDTLATAYALYKVIKYIGDFDLVFCGLQTTDGDTAQVGPQIAERLHLPQVTYCEDFKIEENKIIAKRVVEGGYEWVKMQIPGLITVANSYHPLEYKTLRGARMVQHLLRNEAQRANYIKTITLDDIGADPVKCGLKGSPTIVARTDKVSEIGGSCVIHQGLPTEQMVLDLLRDTKIPEFIKS
ncbi:MAG: electron transfer flavoprotein subunit beta [Candidatus Melainabacteria bacterium RIFCSPLOWO2_02_FULL_35_15]|nr:MAG: electron transfer flavoprotein subunit beta [Candidatus Melainabacteria bacterium RIFCSPLOWO2_12_FULL_35_11]OGI13497.1 MAG: electron transfer flavoprotein subunit beta [Candidatus Melainabacteria bacterium RIFCSPLOWO2_02_FULL_35_15]